MRVTITVHKESYTEKPSRYECTQIRRVDQNELRSVDVYQLARIVANKQSVYLSVHDLSGDRGSTISENTFLRQEVFALDLDHGNFTLEEIHERLAGLPFKPCLIYKTYSYQEPHHRRWRIVFFADRPYSDIQEIKQINEYLMYLMGHDFRDHGFEWVEKLDTSGKDVSRICFGGIGIAAFQDTPPANFDFVFTDDIQQKVQAFITDAKKAKKEYKESLEGAGGNSDTQTSSEALRTAKNGENAIVLAEANDPKSLAQKIIDNLETLSMILPNKPYAIDYYDCYEYINDLPLAMLLGVELGQKFNCILPAHTDLDPSAHILLSVDGKNQHVYHCFGCMELSEVHRTFNVIAYVFEAAFGYTLKQTLESIYTILDIQLGSRYQQKVQKQLIHDVNFLEKLSEEDPFNKQLKARKVKAFYKAFLMLGHSKVSFASMKKGTENEELVFFASNSYLHDYMRNEWNITGLSNISSVNKKINYLVRMGLLSKIDYDDLSSSMLQKLEGYITQAKVREQAETGKKYKRNPDYYQINFLTPQIIERAVQTEQLEKKCIVRSVGQGKAQTTAMHGAKRSKEIYRQSKEGLSRDEKRFVKKAGKVAYDLLKKKAYFTEAELLKQVDRKGNYWKKSEKAHLAQKLMPQLAHAFKLEKKRASKVLREQFELPAKITSNHHIIFSTTSESEWDLRMIQ